MNRYRKGADKERKIVKTAKDLGLIAFRSAGSKSIIDCCIIDFKARTIDLIQAKAPLSPNLKKKLEKENNYLSGVYDVRFKAL